MVLCAIWQLISLNFGQKNEFYVCSIFFQFVLGTKKIISCEYSFRFYRSFSQKTYSYCSQDLFSSWAMQTPGLSIHLSVQPPVLSIHSSTHQSIHVWTLIHSSKRLLITRYMGVRISVRNRGNPWPRHKWLHSLSERVSRRILERPGHPNGHAVYA